MSFSKKIVNTLVFMFSIHAASAWAVDPNPVIKALDSDGLVSITSKQNLSLTVELDSGDQTNINADWWLLAETPRGVYYDNLSDGWQSGLHITYQGPLSDLPVSEVLNVTGLPSGSYTFYFGVDTNMNGILDGALFYDGVSVNIRPSSSYAIVDTNQTENYTDINGEDSDYISNPPSYTDNGDGTVTDNISGLVWQKSPDTDGDGDIDASDKLSFEAAKQYCTNLSLAGYNDWHLPDIKQLYSLIDFSGIDPSGYEGTDTSSLKPFIDTDYFDFAYGDTNAGERIIDSQYASSTLYVGDTSITLLFGVNFADGRIKGYGTTLFGQNKTFLVACIRENGSYGVNDFNDNGGGTITDTATGLMWSQDDSGSDAPDGLNWEEALAWVAAKNNANYLGHNDWRLPNVKELQSIVDYSRSPDTTSSAAIDPVFNATSIVNEAGEIDYAFYWSNTTHANWTENAGSYGAYVSFGRAMGYMNNQWSDVHGAGAQRSDPKSGDPSEYPTGHGPQGDAIRIYNYVRLLRDA